MAKTKTAEKKELEVEVKVAEVVDYLRLTGTYFPTLHEVILRKLAREAALERGIKVSDSELQKAADAFRVVKGLHKKEDMNRWLEASGITLDMFEDYLETNIFMSKLKDKLYEETDSKKYMKDERVHDLMRDLVFAEWMEKEMKGVSG